MRNKTHQHYFVNTQWHFGSEINLIENLKYTFEVIFTDAMRSKTQIS